MEDASPDYRFPSAWHIWTEAEARCVLKAYARLHIRGEQCLPPENQRDWLWRMALQTRAWPVEELLALAHDLAAWGVWPTIPGLERLIQRTLDDMPIFAAGPATLLHNDVTPANAALPHDLDGEAILLDWEMAGWGMAELDLAFMFTQPFRSERDIDKQAALDYYWDQRYALDGRRPASTGTAGGANARRIAVGAFADPGRPQSRRSPPPAGFVSRHLLAIHAQGCR